MSYWALNRKCPSQLILGSGNYRTISAKVLLNVSGIQFPSSKIRSRFVSLRTKANVNPQSICSNAENLQINLITAPKRSKCKSLKTQVI